jgi:hypothetical protein
MVEKFFMIFYSLIDFFYPSAALKGGKEEGKSHFQGPRLVVEQEDGLMLSTFHYFPFHSGNISSIDFVLAANQI